MSSYTQAVWETPTVMGVAALYMEALGIVLGCPGADVAEATRRLLVLSKIDGSAYEPALPDTLAPKLLALLPKQKAGEPGAN